MRAIQVENRWMRCPPCRKEHEYFTHVLIASNCNLLLFTSVYKCQARWEIDTKFYFIVDEVFDRRREISTEEVNKMLVDAGKKPL